jgi:hypothetical protein
MNPESIQWLQNAANSSTDLNNTTLHMLVPDDLVEEFTAFVNEPSQVADQADVWLRRDKG